MISMFAGNLEPLSMLKKTVFDNVHNSALSNLSYFDLNNEIVVSVWQTLAGKRRFSVSASLLYKEIQ